ncbi:hypothetical protein CMQ_7216 [Grosmannia clavigera kw1407]|uniref:HAM1-like N-terminal domain-containing protein n=1 Tax=Grosmannia clavigera (strain kw1407 / UAMH 11150) TaxID=655863 RepID=F0XQE9_GROCL|nr:uncharacterized protein CMQ_7216 [Grosmannia clavigera kw1407]EFX00214.1 hypothetical protein CMQ_7216 [Grosmannia clavigera kw1407]
MKWLFNSCGLCGDNVEDAPDNERQPLLSPGNGPGDTDDTALQQRVRQKLQTFQMLQATTQGYFPSTKQLTDYINTLLKDPEMDVARRLSPSGKKLLRLSREWSTQLVDLLRNKNGGDQIQDFAWYVSRSSVSVDLKDVRHKNLGTANGTAMQQSLQTFGSLLLSNSSVRLLLSDVIAVGREVFRDTAFALSNASQTAASNLESAVLKETEIESETAGGSKGQGDEHDAQDSLQDAKDNVADIANEVTGGAMKVAEAAQNSVSSKLVDNEDNTRDVLLSRLRQAVQQLQQQPDYSKSVSMLTQLLERCLTIYTRTLVDTVEDVAEAVETNDETDAALHNFWTFVSSFGDTEAWEELSTRFQRLFDRARGKNDKQLKDFIHKLGTALQEMLTDPDYFARAGSRLDELRNMVQELDGAVSSASSCTPESSSVQNEFDALLSQMQVTIQSAFQDHDVATFMDTSDSIADLLWPGGQYGSAEILEDAASIFLPQIIQAVQYVPIPRLEVATPDVDLLLENLVLQPGQTVRHSSFLPFRLHLQIRNDFDVRKARFGTAAGIATTASMAIDGLSVAADDVGFVLRLHAGPLLRYTDEGLVSFHLDERGVDVHLDVEVVRDSADTVLALRQTQVHIHHVGFRVRRSRASWLAWLLTPVVRPLLRRTLERQLAEAIAENLRVLNRELVFARERLRAARIASPNDIGAFLRAIAARFADGEGQNGNPDQSVRVGLQPMADGPFAGVYAPGSLARVWEEEAAHAGERVHEYKRDGWRNAVFDVPNVADGQ